MEWLLKAEPYNKQKTENDHYFDHFLNLVHETGDNQINDCEFVIQLISYPNFSKDPDEKFVSYYIVEDNIYYTTFPHGLPDGFVSANSFTNYKTKKYVGHPNGMIIEMNLFKKYGVMSTILSCGRNQFMIDESDGVSYEKCCVLKY